MSARRVILADRGPGYCGGKPLFLIFRIIELTYF
jgi:hypothetical protein